MWEQINGLLTEASNRVVVGVANFLPGVLALFLILLVTLIVAAVVRFGLRRLLRGIDFDNLVVQWGFQEISEWAPRRQPTLLITRIVSWSILILGLLLGISALDAALPSLLVGGTIVASVVWFVGLGLGARALRGLFARPVAWRALDSVIAVIMGALGVGLLATA